MALTLSTAQAFVTKLSADLAAQVERQGAVFPYVVRQYQQAVIASGSALTINHTAADGSVLAGNATDNFLGAAASATLPIQRLLDDADFYASTLATLAQLQVSNIDTAVCALASAFTTNTALGTASTALTQAVLDSAIQTILSNKIVAGDPLYLAISTKFPNGTSAYADLLGLAATVDQTKVGSSAIGNYINYRLSRFRGMTLLRSPDVKTSGAPTTSFNLAFTGSSIAMITCQSGLTNDASNIQAYSTTPKLCLRVALAFDGSDNQAVTVSNRSLALIASNAFGVQVRS